MVKILSTREALIDSLRSFYADRANFDALVSLKQDSRTISLRLLDHFVYHYSGSRGVRYDLPGRELPFEVHVSYKQNLDVQGKLLFDAFGRHERATLTHGEDSVVTSAGQANLVRWAIVNGVLEYIRQNIEAIRADLRAHSLGKKQTRAADKAAGIKKRRADRSFSHRISIHSCKRARVPIHAVKDVQV